MWCTAVAWNAGVVRRRVSSEREERCHHVGAFWSRDSTRDWN